MMTPTVLIVEDEKHTREGLVMALEDGYDVYAVGDADAAERMLKEEVFDVVLTDLRMAGRSGMSVIDLAMKQKERPVCIMMTAYGNVEVAVEAMKRGAYDFLTKPVNLEQLELVIRRGLNERRLKTENVQLHKRLDEKYQFKGGVIGESAALKDAARIADQVSVTKATVMLIGETGTGKELFAQMVHQGSGRAKGPFVAVNCAALPSNLLESELFGHEKGAFTGANERRVGRFEAADKGTLFLDEIGELDLGTQVKLLRFLETKTFERLGSTKTISVDVRVVCATNRDLEEMVEARTFREDLFYRLDVVKIPLPAVRERAGDIPLLMEYYLDHYAKENAVGVPSMTSGAMAVLEKYDWPGNVRELRNLCERLVVMRPGEEINEYDLDEKYFDEGGEMREMGLEGVRELDRDENWRYKIAKSLKKHRGNRTKACEELGISRRTLYRRFKDFPELKGIR